ncbi:MAG: 16S rRNA (guanine(527)-N(7))-methyltransferase RsmG [Clostridia bacterium]|nr:16S rRNA (guanine(527)-N(7))-methyltransferase RsmG [Clostridia bacterium]
MERIENDPRFELYYEMLIDWNQRMNLTSITDRDEVYKKHFFDSLAALPLLKDGSDVIDVGTGAGFPGVPLLILNPTLKMTLVDSQVKRLRFLDCLLQELGLEAELVQSRAEELARNNLYRESYDYVLSRALAALPALLELTVPFARVGGISICYKGLYAKEVTAAKNAASVLNCEMEVKPLKSDYGARCLVLAHKRKRTPQAFPRRSGIPARMPL